MTIRRSVPTLARVVVCSVLLTAVPQARQDERWRALEQQIDRIYKENAYALPRRADHLDRRVAVPAGSERALTIGDYVWSDDGAKLLIFTNTQRVWRQEAENGD